MRKRTLVRAGVAAVTLAALVVLASPIGAFGQSSASPSPTRKVVFVEGTLSTIKAPNPLSPQAVSGEYSVFELNYDTLLRFDKKTLAAAPGLATSWEQSSDGLTWTFHIRDDATWQDGQKLTAHDIAFTYSFIVKNGVGTLSSYLPYSTPKSFQAPNDSTFIWKTTRPVVAPEYPPWIYILPEHIWGKMTGTQATKYKNFPSIGSGPFELTKWDEGQSWTLEANKDYWGGAPVIDEYVYKQYENAQAMIEALKNGEIDYAYTIPPNLFDSLKGVEGVTTNVGTPPGFSNLIMNTRGDYPAPSSSANPIGTGHPALLDERVRMAIAMAINKQDLVDRVLRGYGEPGTSFVPLISSQWHWTPQGNDVIPYDVAGANKILDDAGYLDTDGDGVREMPGGGKPLQMRLDIENEDQTRVKAAQYIVGYLKQIGISLKAQPASYAKTLQFWYANDFDLYMWGWTPDPDPDFLLSTFTTSQCEVWSDTCWSDSEYDKLYKQQQTAATLADRKVIIDRMQQILYQANPEVVLYYDNQLDAYRSDRWTGFQISPEPGGYLLEQITPYSAITIRPISASEQTAAAGGVPGWAWGVVAAGIVVVIVIVVAVRRRGSAEDRA